MSLLLPHQPVGGCLQNSAHSFTHPFIHSVHTNAGSKYITRGSLPKRTTRWSVKRTRDVSLRAVCLACRWRPGEVHHKNYLLAFCAPEGPINRAIVQFVPFKLQKVACNFGCSKGSSKGRTLGEPHNTHCNGNNLFFLLSCRRDPCLVGVAPDAALLHDVDNNNSS